jgi:hypothetical protein
MTQIISKAVLCLVPLALLCTVAHGQDIPAVTSAPTFQGFQLPTELGTMHYALSFGERVRTGYYGSAGDVWTTDVSGEAGYLSRSENRPFSMVYSGGYLHNSSGVDSSVFQDLTLSQTFTTRLWTTNITDAINYLPESPTSGLSGIPGVGDIGVTAPPVGGDTGQDILSVTGQRINNNINVSVERKLTGSTSLQGMGGYFIQRFLTGVSNGINGQSVDTQGGVNHRIDALSKVQGTYTYSHFSYEDQDFTFSTQKITVGYTKQINRKLSVNATVGPQFVSSSGSPLASTSVNFGVDGGIAYTGQRYGYAVDYDRGVRGSSGVVQGTFADSVDVTADRRVGEYMRLSASGSYTHNSSISNLTTQQFAFETLVGNLQVSRTVSQNLNVFLSYSVQDQSTSNIAATTGAFTGTSQTLGFGITYSPRQLHVGHQ